MIGPGEGVWGPNPTPSALSVNAKPQKVVNYRLVGNSDILMEIFEWIPILMVFGAALRMIVK